MARRPARLRRLDPAGRGAVASVVALVLMLPTLLAGCGEVDPGASTGASAGTAVPFDLVRQFCAPAPSETLVDDGAVADRHFDLRVPEQPPTAEASFITASHPLRQNDVVTLSVTSPVYGAVGIHGVTAIETVSEGQRVDLAFRAVYSGRFAVHFHGADGSHYELVALQVTPQRQ